MIRFFKDRLFSRPADKTPKWMMVSELGGAKETTLWLADDAFGKTAAPVGVGATEILVENAKLFPRFGLVRAIGQYIRFSGNDGARLTGIPQSGPGAVRAPIPAGVAIRSANREYVNGSLTIAPEQVPGISVHLSTLGERWTWVNENVLNRIPAGYSLDGSPLLCSFGELAGGSNLLLQYDFIGAGSADVTDLSLNECHAHVQNGNYHHVAAYPLSGTAIALNSGAYLAVDKLAGLFPANGSLEMWVRDASALSTLFSLVDDITGAEKFAVSVNANKTLRVSQLCNTGLLKSYNGVVPLEVLSSGWRQIAISWTGQFISIYVNGALDLQLPIAEPVQDGAGCSCFFGKGSRMPFSGAILKARVWSTPLGLEKVATMWNGGMGWMPHENEPVLGFKLSVRSEAGEPMTAGFTLKTPLINGYDRDPAIAVCNVSVTRRNQGFATQMRLLPAERQVPDTLPPFRWGEYRWREDEQASAEIVPTNWNADLSVFGDHMFVSGICQHPDLELVSLEKLDNNSIVPVVRPGEYFVAAERNYLPAEPVIDIVDATAAGPFTLSAKPRPTTPIFCGRWRSDQMDRYIKDINCLYVGERFSEADEWNPDIVAPQFRLERKTGKVYVTQKLDDEIGLLGVFPSMESRFTFRLPVHPVFKLKLVHLSDGTQPLNWTWNQQAGTVTVEIDPAKQSTWGNQFVLADYTPAFAVFYDRGAAADTVRLTDVELNPAFSGVREGTVFVQHKVRQPKSLMLQVDKARIPYTNAKTDDDIEFGPVYPEDFAVLTVTAFGNLSTELIPGAKLKVLVDNLRFAGAVNYQNPAKDDVWVTTGADGNASLVYTPGNTFGYYISPDDVDGDLVSLPEPVDIKQLYDFNTDTFLIHLYGVLSDDPYLGKAGADVAVGEIPFATTGAPGSPGYKTNGRRLQWKDNSGNPVFPTDITDVDGISFRDARFNGKAQYITYSDAIVTGATTAAYFVAFAGRVTIRLYSPDFNVTSNPITLRVVPPEQITEVSYLDDSVWAPIAGYLTMNDFAQQSGRLNVNRLAGGPLLHLRFSKRI